MLAPYIEFVRGDRLSPTPADELRGVAAELLDIQVARVPGENPVRRFCVRLTADLPDLLEDQRAYHLYAFATVRQCGAAWDAASGFLGWLANRRRRSAGGGRRFVRVAGRIRQDSSVQDWARASATGKSLDPVVAIDEMATTWEQAVQLLGAQGR